MADSIISGVDDRVLVTVCCGAFACLLAAMVSICSIRDSTGRVDRSSSVPSHRSYDNDVCPICLGTHRLPIESNCGHKFCGSCLKNYVSRTSGNTLFGAPVSCPLCRQDVNILLLGFSSEEFRSVELAEERRDVERAVRQYNFRFGRGPREPWSYVRDCPVLIRHMFHDFFTFGGLVWIFRLRVLLCCFGAFVYAFNPFDIIPEAIFGVFGFLDDAIVFLLCVIYMSVIYRRLIISRAMNDT